MEPPRDLVRRLRPGRAGTSREAHAAVRAKGPGAAPDRAIASWATRVVGDRPTVLFSGDTLHRTNWGCRATTTALRGLVEARADIGFTVDTKVWSAYLEGTGLDEGAATPSTVAGLERFSEALRDAPGSPLNTALARADAVMINGEGALLDFLGSGRRHLALAHAAATAFATPVAIVNHSCDIRDPRLDALAAAVYPELTDAVFREPASHRAMGDRAAPGVTFAEAGDAAFTCRPSGGPPMVDGPYVCLGSSARWRYQRRRGADPRPALVQLGLRLGEIAPVVVVAVEQQEEGYLRDVARALGRPLVGSATPTAAAVDLLAGACAYVGGRWHTAIKGLVGGTPPVLFSTNSINKTQGLLEQVGLALPAWDFHDLAQSVDEIAEATRDLVAEGDALRDRLRLCAADLSRSAVDHTRMLASI